MEENNWEKFEVIIKSHKWAYRGNVQSVLSVHRGRWLNFRGAEELVIEQTGFRQYTADMPCYRVMRDMVRVMAEVYMIASRNIKARVQVGGEELEAGMVAEICMELSGEMLESVWERIREYLPKVKCIKPYLRAVLYNAVFEIGTDEERMEETVRQRYCIV